MVRPNSTLSAKTFPLLDSDVVLRGIMAFNSPGVAGFVGTANIRIGRIAAGSEILTAKLKTATAWVGPTAATISLGSALSAPNYNDIIAATSVLAIGGTVTLAAGALALEFLTDTDLFMQFIGTVAPATAGLTRGILDIAVPLQGTAALVNNPAGTPLPG